MQAAATQAAKQNRAAFSKRLSPQHVGVPDPTPTGLPYQGASGKSLMRQRAKYFIRLRMIVKYAPIEARGPGWLCQRAESPELIAL
jgi:hypothetical protein